MNRRHLVFAPIVVLAGCSDTASSVDWGGYIVKAFEQLGSDLKTVQMKAGGYASTAAWRGVSDFDVAAAGAGACALPAAGYATLPAEFLYLMRQVYDSAMGVGFILNKSATKADFANILALWSNELKLDERTLANTYMLAERVAKEVEDSAAQEVLEKAVTKSIEWFKAKYGTGGVTGAVGVVTGPGSRQATEAIVSQVLAEKAGTKAAGKLAPKVAAKTGAKIGAKYGAKAALAWIPIVSAIVCGGVNAWIMDSILDTAETYFKALGDYRRRRYGGSGKK
jgi:hypothetical protein